MTKKTLSRCLTTIGMLAFAISMALLRLKLGMNFLQRHVSMEM